MFHKVGMTAQRKYTKRGSRDDKVHVTSLYTAFQVFLLNTVS